MGSHISKMQQQALEKFDRYIPDATSLDIDSAEARAGFLTPSQEKAFDRYLTWVDSVGGFEALDKSALRSGDVGAVYDEMSHEWTYYSTGDGNEAFAEGLYDDFNADFIRYPWAYPEHPNFKAIYARKFAQPTPEPEKPKPLGTSVLSETGSTSLNEAFVSRVSDATKAVEKLDSSAQDALETIQREPTASFVDAQRQGFLPFIQEAQVQQAVSSAQSDILKSFIDQFRQQQQDENLEIGSANALTSSLQQRQLALSNILRTNPAFLTRGFRQAAQQAEEAQEFKNIIQDIEKDPLDVLGEQATPVDFIDFNLKKRPEGFDLEDDPFVGAPETSLDAFLGTSEEATVDPLSDFTTAQTESAAKETQSSIYDEGLTESVFSGTIDTQSEADAKGLAAQTARAIDVNFAVPFGLAAERSDFFSKDTVLTEIGKGVLSGFITGANPALGAPIGGLSFLSPASLIGAGVFAAGKAGIDIAQSEYTGFGIGNFFSAFFNALIPFGLVGESVAEQENIQEQMDLLAEDVFSSMAIDDPMKSKEMTSRDFYDTYGTLVPPTTPQEQIQREIEIQRELALPFFLDELSGPDGGGASGITGPTAGLGEISFSNAGVFGFDFDEGFEGGFDGPSEGGGADPGFGGGDF
jgi:hypothetical protein